MSGKPRVLIVDDHREFADSLASLIRLRGYDVFVAYRTLDGLRVAAPGSRLVFTYVRRTFIDGTNRYGTRTLYRKVRQRQQLWHFGLEPDDVADFIAEYGWRLVEQAGPDELVARYVEPTGRKLKASQLEWSAFAEKI